MTEYEEKSLEELRAIRDLLETMPNRILDLHAKRVRAAMEDNQRVMDSMRASMKPPRF